MSQPDPRIIGYNSVRRALGLLGFALPVALYSQGRIFGGPMQPSISDFYHSPMGDILVGSLCAIGIFLIAYKGYPKGKAIFGDNWVSTLAGIGAIGVALFPTTNQAVPACTIEPCYVTGLTFHPAWLHYASAAVFFVCLAIFCFVLFPQGERNEISTFRKKTENATYRICGTLLVLSIFALGYYNIADSSTQAWMNSVNYIFWFETLGVIAFAISWLTKGKIIAGIRSVVAR